MEVDGLGKTEREVGSSLACQQVCQKTTDCEFFTYIVDQKECKLKSPGPFLKWSFERKVGYVSGRKYCHNRG